MAAKRARVAPRRTPAARRREAGMVLERKVAALGLFSMQRSRVLAAAVGAFAEHGYADASVAVISARAGVSRRTFYELFDNREQCLIAILRDAEARVERGLAASVTASGWRERIRAGLWSILCLFDCEPALAKVCLVESQRGGAAVLAERERIFARLAQVVDQGRSGDGVADREDRGGSTARSSSGHKQVARSQAVGPLTAEALVGAVVAVLQARLAHSEARTSAAAQTLCDLLGELTALIVLPYQGAAAAHRERMRSTPGPLSPTPAPVQDLAVAMGCAVDRRGAGGAVHGPEAGGAVHGPDAGDPLAHLPARFTYRTGRVLQAVAELGEGAGPRPSNRAVAERAGVRDAGQISKLLARLRRLGLLANAAAAAYARGEANHWELTPAGRRLLEVIGAGESSEGSDAEWLSRAMLVRRAES